MGISSKRVWISILTVLIFISIITLKENYSSSKNADIQINAQNDYFPTNEWRTSTPEEQGIDSSKLADMLKSIEKNSGIRSVLIIRHGHLILESYRAPYNRDTAMNIMSVTKSFMSALTGIAIRENYFTGVKQKVSDLLPEYFAGVDSRKKEITLKHLLTMSSGLPSVEPYDDMFLWPRSKDWVEHVINLPLESDPGAKFKYSSGMNHLMSAIITKTSGMSTLEFAEKYLFDPIGISIERWDRDPNGIYNGGAYLSITPRDMAKFGYLYLNGGACNGKQIIPREWVESSTKSQIKLADNTMPVDKYGYWWWVGKDYYLASGWGGQYIIINPKLDMVVVFTSIDAHAPLDVYKNYICPAVKSNTSLKPNPSAVEKVNVNIDRLAKPVVDYVKPDSELIKRINGKVFKINHNELGLDSFSLNINDSSCTFSYTQMNMKGQLIKSEFPVGINGEYKITSIEYHPTYFEVDKDQFPVYKPGDVNKLFFNNKLFFPIDEPGGTVKHSVAFEGHWTDENTFLLKGIWPLENPFSYLTVIKFNGDEVDLTLLAAPIDFRYNIEGTIDIE